MLHIYVCMYDIYIYIYIYIYIFIIFTLLQMFTVVNNSRREDVGEICRCIGTKEMRNAHTLQSKKTTTSQDSEDVICSKLAKGLISYT